jgi:hypothetical protein
MKKIVCVMVMLLLSLSLVIANAPATSQHTSTPISSQEMSSIVGGGWCGCACVNLWIVTLCACFTDPTGLLCE